MVIPLFLRFVGMTAQFDIAAKPLSGTEVPGALVADFLAAGVVPGIKERIGCRLDLLVGGNVDGAVGVKVVVGAHRNATPAEVGAGIGHRRVDVVVAEGPMIGAEDLEAAAETGTDVLSLGGEDKEDIIDVGFPAIDALSMRDFLLHLAVRDRIGRVGCCIHPGACENGIAGETATSLGILYVVVVQLGSPDIAKITGDQAIVLGAHKRAFGLPEDSIGIGSTSHYWATVVNKVASIRFTSMLFRVGQVRSTTDGSGARA